MCYCHCLCNRIKEEQKARLEASEAKSKEDSATMEAAAKAELDEWHAKNEKAKAEKVSFGQGSGGWGGCLIPDLSRPVFYFRNF